MARFVATAWMLTPTAAKNAAPAPAGLKSVSVAEERAMPTRTIATVQSEWRGVGGGGVEQDGGGMDGGGVERIGGDAEHLGSEGCGEVGEWVEWVENTEQGG